MSWRQWLIAATALLAVAVSLALVVAASGLYNVAATRGHLPMIDWFLRIGMHRSVSLHSRGVEAPALDSPDRIRLGAAHFHVGCGPCHGVPGGRENPIYEGMLPQPPGLNEAVGDFEDRELFWIVRHGLKYAGMPGWSGEGRDDEVWSVVAFLRQLPELQTESYRELVAGNATRRHIDVGEMPDEGTEDFRLTACARCHDNGDAPATSLRIPPLAGQSPGYLAAALRDYRDGLRESGFMEPVAVELDDEEIVALATYYAGLEPPAPSTASVHETHSNGAALALRGDPARDVPACDACHGPGSLDAYPRLAGLPAPYQIGQLQLWQSGGRQSSAAGRTMAVIASRLAPEQIEAVSAYYASADAGSRAAAEEAAP